MNVFFFSRPKWNIDMLDGVSSPKRKYPTKIFTNMQRRSVCFSYLSARAFLHYPISRSSSELYCIVCCRRTHKGYVKSDFWPCIIQTNNFFSPAALIFCLFLLRIYFSEGRGGNYSRSSLKRTQIFGWINARNSGSEGEEEGKRTWILNLAQLTNIVVENGEKKKESTKKFNRMKLKWRQRLAVYAAGIVNGVRETFFTW